MPQLDRAPLCPMQVWHQTICLKPGRTGLIPLLQSLHPPHHQNRRTTQNYSNPPCHDNVQTSHRKMLMGTALPHLQKCRRTWRRGLGWQSTKSAKNAPSKPSAPDHTKPSAAESSMPTATNPSVSPTTKQSTC